MDGLSVSARPRNLQTVEFLYLDGALMHSASQKLPSYRMDRK